MELGVSTVTMGAAVCAIGGGATMTGDLPPLSGVEAGGSSTAGGPALGCSGWGCGLRPTGALPRGRCSGALTRVFFGTVQVLTVSSSLKNPVTGWGQVVDVLLELWAVLVVAGSAGAIAAFFQTGDA